MGETLVGKSTVTFVWIASNENAVEALRVFIQGHYEFMKEKSYREKEMNCMYTPYSPLPTMATAYRNSAMYNATATAK